MHRLSWPAYKRLLQYSDRPILCGPWRGEVGFEALYWLPWLTTLNLPPERLIPITRGGAHVWYTTKEHVELYDLCTLQAVRVENNLQVKKTGMLKQMGWTLFDRQIVEQAATRLARLGRYHTLHPHWMFQDLAPYWEGRKGLAWLKSRQLFTALPAPTVPIALPDKFVAVRFYFRYTFPHAEATIATAKAAIQQIASKCPVILLDSGVHADEHIDVSVKDVPNVSRLADLVPGITPQNNLAVLSAVLAKSMGFVGTYGGLAQLALRYAKPSVSFYAQWGGTMIAHKHLADAISTETGVPFIVLRLTDAHLLRNVLPDIVIDGGVRGSSLTPRSTTT